jgi:hypothetical protein
MIFPDRHLTALRIVTQQVVGKDERKHSFSDRHASNRDARIVATVRDDVNVIAVHRHAALRGCD